MEDQKVGGREVGEEGALWGVGGYGCTRGGLGDENGCTMNICICLIGNFHNFSDV